MIRTFKILLALSLTGVIMVNCAPRTVVREVRYEPAPAPVVRNEPAPAPVAQKEPAPALAAATPVFSKVKTARSSYYSTKNETFSSLAMKHLYWPEWGGTFRQKVYYDCREEILAQFPETQEMKDYWELLANLEPKPASAPGTNNYYVRWGLKNGKWVVVEGEPMLRKALGSAWTTVDTAPVAAAKPAELSAPTISAATTADTTSQDQGKEINVLKKKVANLTSKHSRADWLKKLAELGYEGDSAVTDFQKAHCLKADGIVGTKTAAEIDKALCERRKKKL